jgi:nucleotide-binding universal stress UspA family protein
MPKRKVVVAVDGSNFSHRIFPVIARLLDGASTEIVLLRVGERVTGHIGSPPRVVTADTTFVSYESPSDYDAASHPIYASQEQDSALADFRASTQGAAEVLENAGFEVSYEIRFGDPAEKIIDYVNLTNVDLVAMTTHWRTGLDKVLHGNTLTSILPEISAPILVLRPDDE